MKISSQEQIQRLNKLVQEMDQFASLSLESLTRRPSVGHWSFIEIVGHLNLAYRLYKDRMEALLNVLPDQQEIIDETNIRGVKGFFIKNMAPQSGQRRWKMKTFSTFKPVFDLQEMDQKSMEKVFTTFFDDMDHFKHVIKASRTKDCSRGKLHSAIGPALKFTLPEAIAFNLNHIERHLLQMKETIMQLEAIGTF